MSSDSKTTVAANAVLRTLNELRAAFPDITQSPGDLSDDAKKKKISDAIATLEQAHRRLASIDDSAIQTFLATARSLPTIDQLGAEGIERGPLVHELKAASTSLRLRSPADVEKVKEWLRAGVSVSAWGSDEHFMEISLDPDSGVLCAKNPWGDNEAKYPMTDLEFLAEFDLAHRTVDPVKR
jgi:hypothetical protein